MESGRVELIPREGEFALGSARATGCKGSMLPKVEACLEFVNALPGRTAIITSLEKAPEALHGKAGTRICSEEAEFDYAPLEMDSMIYDVNAS
mgnify:CR=1 FL=1